MRYLSEQEWLTAKEKGDSPAARSAVTQTPAATDGAKPKAQSAPVAKAEVAEEVAEPTKRVSKKAAEPAAKKDFVDVLNTWTDDE